MAKGSEDEERGGNSRLRARASGCERKVGKGVVSYRRGGGESDEVVVFCILFSQPHL